MIIKIYLLLPDIILFKIFYQFEYKDLVNVCKIRRTWNRIGNDDYLWLNLKILYSNVSIIKYW